MRRPVSAQTAQRFLAVHIRSNGCYHFLMVYNVLPQLPNPRCAPLAPSTSSRTPSSGRTTSPKSHTRPPLPPPPPVAPILASPTPSSSPLPPPHPQPASTPASSLSTLAYRAPVLPPPTTTTTHSSPRPRMAPTSVAAGGEGEEDRTICGEALVVAVLSSPSIPRGSTAAAPLVRSCCRRSSRPSAKVDISL
jgi:hypothetical protein